MMISTDNKQLCVAGSRRRGVTVLEVLFAVFVVVVGLLGIASVIGVAGRNTADSNAASTSQALGQQWLSGFVARGLNQPDHFTSSGLGYDWQWYRDYVTPPPVNAAPGYEVFQRVEDANVGLYTGTNDSPSFSGNPLPPAAQRRRTWGHQAVCIDPHFFSRAEVRARITAGATRFNGYRASVFPFYEDHVNPISDPAEPRNAANSWPDQPRMMRVTLGQGVARASAKLIDEMFSSIDDLASTTDFDKALGLNDPTNAVPALELQDDNSVPAVRIASDATGFKAASKGEFKWMATLSPAEPPAPEILANPAGVAGRTVTDYLLSLVVTRKHDSSYLPVGPTPVTPGLIEDKPTGERITWVIPLSGNFTGGTGGRVRIVANEFVDDALHIGDWIMLGRSYLVDTSVVPARQYSYFRWYRVIAVDEESRLDLLGNVSPVGTDPFGGGAATRVWSRDVVLEGPDFAFDPILAGAGPPVPRTPTTGVLYEGVTTVVERRIALPD